MSGGRRDATMDCNNTPALLRQATFWTRDKEERLIGLYSQFSLLWDRRHPDYYKRERREHAMRAIAAALNNDFDVLTVKKKIRNMRDYFVKELKKEHVAAQSSPPRHYLSRWKHFNAWNFLRKVLYSVPTTPNSVNMPQAVQEIKAEPQDVAESHESRVLSSLLDLQSSANIRQVSTLQSLPPRGHTQETKPRLPKSPLRAPTLPAHVTAFADALHKRPQHSSSQEPPSPVQVCEKPKMPTLPGPNRTLHPSVMSEANSNGTLESTANARRQHEGSSENLTLCSKDTCNALFCGQLIQALRKMSNVQRECVKLRFMQILFDVKYKA